jgi:hypothetical protein
MSKKQKPIKQQPAQQPTRPPRPPSIKSPVLSRRPPRQPGR